MIHELNIIDLNKSKFRYVLDDERDTMGVLNSLKSVSFKRGLNLVVGENGCGKTTMLNMLSYYCMCMSGSTKISFDVTDRYCIREMIFRDDNECGSILLDGIEVKNNYAVKVSRLIIEEEKKNNDILGSVDSFASYFYSRGLSSGQTMIHSIMNTFDYMFNDNLVTDMSILDRKMNSVWSPIQQMTRDFISKNNVEEDENVFTLLMDEPDRSLDIHYLRDLKEIFSNQKPNGQMIVTLHNPLLIHGLAKMSNVNVIELTPGYVNEISQAVESILK